LGRRRHDGSWFRRLCFRGGFHGLGLWLRRLRRQLGERIEDSGLVVIRRRLKVANRSGVGLARRYEPLPDRQHDIVVERTGMRLLLSNAQIGQQVYDHPGLDFQFPSKLIDSNFAHT